MCKRNWLYEFKAPIGIIKFINIYINTLAEQIKMNCVKFGVLEFQCSDIHITLCRIIKSFVHFGLIRNEKRDFETSFSSSKSKRISLLSFGIFFYYILTRIFIEVIFYMVLRQKKTKRNKNLKNYKILTFAGLFCAT